MIDFFKKDCQQHTNALEFGLCDETDENEKTPAFINEENSALWIAKVSNQTQKNVIFTAIDNCISILRTDGNMEKSCDGMLTHDDNIDFVELKEGRMSWIQGGIEQLKITVEIFSENHDLSQYRKKRAFLANRKHPHFQHSRKEDMQKFKNETDVRLIIHNRIKI